MRHPDPTTLLRAFLHQRPTANAAHLAQKAVVGLEPREFRNVVVWPET
jgi:hypothetical protein